MRRFGLIVISVLVLGCSMGAFAQEEEEAKETLRQTRTFDVRDLLMPVQHHVGPTFELQNLSAASGTAAPGGSGIFGDEENGGFEEAGQTPEESLDDLINLIREVVEPISWDEASGNAIRGRQGIIVATHEPAVLDKVKTLLDELRKVQWRMVSVHVSIVRPKPESLKTIVERRLFLATDAKQQAELRQLAGDVVAEGRIVCREGQRVYTAASTQRNFVQDVTEEVTVPEKEGERPVVGSDPDIGTVQDGLTVDVQPVIAEDGSVMMDFRCSMAVITDIENVPAGGTDRAKETRWHVQLPHIAVMAVRGQYRIADGGMLFASGGSMLGDEPKGLYTLIQVDIIDAKKPANK